MSKKPWSARSVTVMILRSIWLSIWERESKGNPMDDPFIEDFYRQLKQVDQGDWFDRACWILTAVLVLGFFGYHGLKFLIGG